jgi:hypothetical protein
MPSLPLLSCLVWSQKWSQFFLGRFRPAPRNAIEEQIGRAWALVLKMIQADFRVDLHNHSEQHSRATQGCMALRAYNGGIYGEATHGEHDVVCLLGLCRHVW